MTSCNFGYFLTPLCPAHMPYHRTLPYPPSPSLCDVNEWSLRRGWSYQTFYTFGRCKTECIKCQFHLKEKLCYKHSRLTWSWRKAGLGPICRDIRLIFLLLLFSVKLEDWSHETVVLNKTYRLISCKNSAYQPWAGVYICHQFLQYFIFFNPTST